MSLKVSVTEKSKGIFTIAPVGSLDSNTHMILEKELEPLLKRNPQVLIFDLEELKYISSIGLRIVFKTKKTLKNYDGKMMMVNLQPQIKEVFKIVNALPDEPIFESVRELDEYLLTMQKRNIENRT
jgi:anti-anti-sigma factor